MGLPVSTGSWSWQEDIVMSDGTSKSYRDRVRDEAESTIRKFGRPMHCSELARIVLAALELEEKYSQKDVNQCLHDDSKHRFVRVSRGTWTLR